MKLPARGLTTAFTALLTIFSIALPALAQRPHGDRPHPNLPEEHRLRGEATPAAPAESAAGRAVDERPVITHHQITIAGKTLDYTATAALMPIQNSSGETEAHIFYMAYTLDGAADRSKRPLTFAFNGGPGSASVWLHMGAMGPRRPKLLDNGGMPQPPFQVVDNENTWLDQTDLVFIDPVGTGYSRAKTNEAARRINGVQGDIQSIGEFMRMYLTRNERWGSPLFIVGESYGTFRAAGLAGSLIDKGIALNGIVLVSTVLDFAMIEPSISNGLPYATQLPTMAADAWYHKRLSPDLQKDLHATLRETEQWAMTDYIQALNKGDKLTSLERKAVIEKLAHYTSLDPRDIDDANLRIDSGQFIRRLLRDKKLTIGAYDGRLTGALLSDHGGRDGFDPSMSYPRPPFESAFQQYIRSELNYKTDLDYNVLGLSLPWDWDSNNHFAQETGSLRSAMAKNPHLQILVCAGYYDIVTPYFSAEYTMNHLGLPADMTSRIHWAHFEAGHMMYIDRDCRAKLKRDATDFIGKSLP